MKYFTVILFSSLIFFGCSSKSDKEFFETAETNLENDNVPDAVVNYENLVKEYPDSELAPEALFKLATLYQHKMIKNLNENESMEKAAGFYKEVFTEYPDYKDAPLALFMAAFIQANDLGEYEEASKNYKLFLQKFPDHELALSAREELNNMGVSPNDILEKKSKTNI